MKLVTLRSVAVLMAALASTPLLAAAAPGEVSADPTGIVFSKPERIRYDNHSLIIDGKPVFIYSGGVHYFRCPRELWKERLEKLKAAGLNCVETYLAWDVHEPEEPAGPDDFSKLQKMEDISDFIATARGLGLYVIIRPGPYICAEWDRGGLPGWLMKERPENLPLGQYLRNDSERMLAWDRHWITATAKVIKPQLVTNLPPGTPGVILWQLENEYEYPSIPAQVKANVLRALGHDAIDSGIDVPLFTCFSKNKVFREDPFLRSHVYDTTNAYPGFNMKSLAEGIEGTASYQPEKFRGMSELQGGWFAQVGGKLSDQQGHNAAQLNQLTLVALEEGVTSMNYYMFYGGSNFGYGAAQNLIQSYDYNAPLREPGGIADRYLTVAALGQFIKAYGTALTQAERVKLTITDSTQPGVSVVLRRAPTGERFYFVRTTQQREGLAGTVSVQPEGAGGGDKITIHYDLPAFGAKVLVLPAGVSDPAQGEWWPRLVEGPAHPAALPPAIAVSSMQMRPDVAEKFIDAPAGKSLIAVNIFDQRYVTYRVSFDLTEAEVHSPLALRVTSEGGGDGLRALINGQPLANGRGNILPLGTLVHAGTNSAEILFENRGSPNFGADLEKEQGITQVTLVPADADKPLSLQWKTKSVTGSLKNRPEVAATYDDHEWRAVSIDGEANLRQPNTSAIYRATLKVTPDQIAAGVPLSFGHIDDTGTVYVNGEAVGESHDWAQPFAVDITSKLHEGDNSLAVAVHNDGGTGGLYGGLSLSPAGKVLSGVQVTGDTAGLREHWETTALTAEWKPVKESGVAAPMLAWYRMQFDMPAAPKDAWIPWKLHLEGDANGFVYFNGHLLGRYWAVGPQRDYWLPDCWLHQGDGQANVIALQVRATGGGPAVKAAEVRPYAEYAERR